MHYGFWNNKTKNRQQAILNENQKVINIGRITKNMRVLDAGCGVGGTAIYIAQKTGATVWGVTIDPKQVRLADYYANKRGVQTLTHFSTQDFTKTSFPANYFDVVYGIESVCHTETKSSFLHEAYRILKPGGKLIIMDGYRGQTAKTPMERKMFDTFCTSLAVPPLITGTAMLRQVRAAGFDQCVMQDKTDAILPTSREFARIANLTQIFCTVAGYISHPFFQTINRNYLALRAGDGGFQSGLLQYFVHVGEKTRQKRKIQ